MDLRLKSTCVSGKKISFRIMQWYRWQHAHRNALPRRTKSDSVLLAKLQWAFSIHRGFLMNKAKRLMFSILKTRAKTKNKQHAEWKALAFTVVMQKVTKTKILFVIQ